MRGNRILKILSVFVISVVLSNLVYMYEVSFLKQHLEYEVVTLEHFTACHEMFNHYKAYDFLDIRNINIYIPILLFYVVGMIVGSPFLSCRKKERCFACVRYPKWSHFIKHEKRGELFNIILFAAIFEWITYVKFYLSYIQLIDIRLFLLYTLRRISVLYFICNLGFIIYRMKDRTDALIIMILMVIFLIMVDMPVYYVCVIANEDGVIGYAWLIICFLAAVISEWITRKSLYKWEFVDM